MPVREIIKIDEELCDGCGDCVSACAEGAIQIINGKARLVSETYCDGLGACIGDCPVGAITIEKRNVADYDEAAVEKHLERLAVSQPKPKPQPLPAAMPVHAGHAGGGCPGSAMRQFNVPKTQASAGPFSSRQSTLGQWPIQLMLVPPGAPFIAGADILVCADCVPFASADFHEKFQAGKAILVGCPKLDDLNFYFEKLKMIFTEARPKSITVLKMEVPCCNGIAQAAVMARNEVASDVELEVTTIGIRGDELDTKRIERNS